MRPLLVVCLLVACQQRPQPERVYPPEPAPAQYPWEIFPGRFLGGK